MKLRVSFLLIAFLIQLNFYAQNVAGVHQVEKTTQNNEYLIKTSVSGLKNVDIAKLVIEVDSSHQFKKSANNPYFFDRKSNEVKFYVMGVPPSGEINLEFSIVLSKEGDFTFPVKFQYSKNEEKQQLDLPKIKISNLILLANETQNTNQAKEQAEAEKRAELEKEKQLEEEKLAKNIARFNAEQEEKKRQEESNAKELAEQKESQQKMEAEKLAKAEAEKQAKLAQEKLLVEQKQKEEMEAKQIAEEQAQQKAKNEKELQQKIALEKLAKVEAEKQVKLEEEKLLAEQKKAQETKIIAEEKKSNLKTYSVQLLSLANYSEERLSSYCKKHNLSKDKIIKRQIGNLMKISYGKVTSQSEATILQQKLKNQHQIEASFIVVLN